jgi:hypothetical protein
MTEQDRRLPLLTLCLASRVVPGRGIVYCGLPRHDDRHMHRASLNAATTETVEWR